MNDLNHNPKRIVNAFLLLFFTLFCLVYTIFTNHNLLFAEAATLVKNSGNYDVLKLEDYIQISEAFFPKTINCAGYSDKNKETMFLICDMNNPSIGKKSFKEFSKEVEENSGVSGEITYVKLEDVYISAAQIDGLIFLEFSKESDNSRLRNYLKEFKEYRIPFLVKVARNYYGI